MPPVSNVETANLVELLTRRLNDLRDFQIPRLRDFKGTLATQQQHAFELQEDLAVFERNVRDLKSLADDQTRETDRRAVAHQAQRFATSLDQMRQGARVALLTSKRAIDATAQSNRDELLRSTVMSQNVSSDMSENALIAASNDVTDALRRTIGLMQTELERSVRSSQMLEQSSANLRSATLAHDTLSSLLSTSKHLITALEKSDWLDRLLILAALAFFVLVVLFILKQRVLDKGLRIAFWWTRWLPHQGSGDVEFLKSEMSDKNMAMMTATATTGSAVSSFFLSTSTSTGAGQPSSFLSPTDAMTAASSDLFPSPSTAPMLHTPDVDELIHEPVPLPSQSGSLSETSTMLQKDEYRQHSEL